jgi:Acyltransferase
MTRAASLRGARLVALPLTLLGLLLSTSDAFLINGPRLSQPPRLPAVAVAISPPPEDVAMVSDVRYLSKEETNPLIRIGKGEKEKIINAFGLWCAAVSLVTGPVWMAAMSLVDMMNQQNSDWDPHRAWFDSTGKIWAKVWLTMTMSYPTVSGEVGWLKQSTSSASTVGPCMYVANHASWLDIPVLCTVLDPVFKFIAKGELRKVPCIGQQLNGVR